MSTHKRMCVFIDLDGTMIKHCSAEHWHDPIELLPGVLAQLCDWELQGAKIIIVTGRKRSNEFHLRKQLEINHVPYDQLIMDCGSGIRILVNDKKGEQLSAYAVNVQRDTGMPDKWELNDNAFTVCR